MNSLPKTVTRQRHNCDLNPGPSAPESSTLTTRLSSHPVIIVGCVKSKPMTAMTAVSVGVTTGNMTGHLPPGLLSPHPNHRRRQLPGLQLIHTVTPDTTKLSCLCRVNVGGVNWTRDNSRLSPTENLKSEHVQSSRPIHTATPDTTQTGPSCLVWRAV